MEEEDCHRGPPPLGEHWIYLLEKIQGDLVAGGGRSMEAASGGRRRRRDVEVSRVTPSQALY
jgi:hypothetical protein